MRERIDALTDASPGGCWLWLGSVNAGGYGTIGHDGRVSYVHRLVYEFNIGRLPKDAKVDHRCRNRRCIRPDHLQIATTKVNAENLDGARPSTISGVRGVHWDAGTGRWRAKVQHNGRHYHAGRFDSVEDAEQAAIALRNSLFSNNLKDRRET